MKNILAENLLRFGVKNLSESSQKQLVVKSIMETINQHGLHTEVRRALTEADAPSKPDAVIDFSFTANKYKFGFEEGKGERPLVIQSNTSLSEASTILGQIMKLVGSGQAESPQMINIIKQITANNYPMILWKVRYGSTFKSKTGSNYNTVCDWLSKSVDAPTTRASSVGTIGGTGGGKGPIGTVSDYLRGTKTGEAIQAHLKTLNEEEYF